MIAAGLTNMPPIGDEPVSNTAWFFLGAVAIAVYYLFVAG